MPGPRPGQSSVNMQKIVECCYLLTWKQKLMNVQSQVSKFDPNMIIDTSGSHIALHANTGIDMFRIPRSLNFRVNVDETSAKEQAFVACDDFLESIKIGIHVGDSRTCASFAQDIHDISIPKNIPDV
eukprot:1845116-Karenia_brevis.AAC.1